MYAVVAITTKRRSYSCGVDATTRTFVEFVGSKEECEQFVVDSADRYCKVGGNISVAVDVVEIGNEASFAADF